MYVGGGAVDYEQSYLLGGLVVVCKNWRWAALVSSAARVAALASNNCLGPLETELMITSDRESNESVTLPDTPPRRDFQQLCDKVWQGLCLSCDDVNVQLATLAFPAETSRCTDPSVTVEEWDTKR